MHRAAPVVLGAAALFLARAAQRLVPLGGGGGAGLLGLREAGADVGTVEDGEERPPLDVRALARRQLGDAADDLGGDVRLGGFDLPLDLFRARLGAEPDGGDEDGGGGEQRDDEGDAAEKEFHRVTSASSRGR